MIDTAGQCYITHRIQVAAPKGLTFLAGQAAVFNRNILDSRSGRDAPEVAIARGNPEDRFVGVFAGTSLSAVTGEDVRSGIYAPYCESCMPVILMGHNIVPTDCYDVAEAYEPGQPLYTDYLGRWTPRQRQKGLRPYGSVFSPPSKDYPFLAVEFSTPTIARNDT